MWKSEWKWLLGLTAVFCGCFYLPVGVERFDRAIIESLELVKWYAQEHVLLCLIPALFIAGAIGVYISHDAVMRYLGPKANKVIAYGVASISGAILAVCSCTILPLFAGIHKRGAGLGPASTFLYSGPAINIMAVILTARVLGVELGVARAIGAIVVSILIGLCMQFLFRKEETAKQGGDELEPSVVRPLWQTILFLAGLIGILIFANWGEPQSQTGLWRSIWNIKWHLTGGAAILFGIILTTCYRMKLWKVISIAVPVTILAIRFPERPVLAFTAGFLILGAFTSTDKDPELKDWFETSWTFAKKILPLLLFGVMIAGLLLGRSGQEGLIPRTWIEYAVGGNTLLSTFCASLAGAFMYFATLTEVPILEGLIGAGMGKGPALALLLAGPALSLPSMLIINSILGFKKTFAFITLVVIFSTLTGYIYGCI